ncbi:Gfo/Idh/MocA family protein [Glaciibacter superstes]|uniref:Gfo/Idh/MocA family protein n=1 Tax=Glaciibacter superstes TaxID=501023 RepID=UPI000A04D38A|nr:Gfo/Idh/MocA family oxidoreductase [Glaciibacter superstes]
MTARVRVVVAGAGRFGSLHVRTWREAGADVVAVVDADASRAAAVASRFDIAVSGDDLARVLAEAKPDAVVVASDESTHTVVARTAIAAGCHVFVEKPLALSGRDAKETIDAAESQGLHVIAGQISRFAQPYVYLKQAISSGRLGELWTVRLRRDFTRSWLNDFGSRVHPVWESCIHDIDLALYLTGEQPQRVFAVQTRQGTDVVPSAVSVLVELSGGKTATIESAWSVPDRGPQSLAGALDLSGTIAGECEVIGEGGTVKQRLLSDAITEWGDNGVIVPDLSLWPEQMGRIGGALRAEVDHAINVFSGTRGNEIMPHREALWGVQMAEAIIRSLETGLPEKVGQS